MSNKVFVSTSIPYVNGEPHVGFAMEGIEADVVARYFRLIGKDTFFSTGADENGVKIYKTAHAQGIDTQELCDKNAQKFKDLGEALGFSNNGFIRTTDQKKHWPGAQEMWKRIQANDDIYKKTYEGLYCEGCETFVTEKELVDGNCPNHKKPPVKIAEENYFFRLSKYTDQIKELILNNTLKVVPDFRKNEILALLEEGLQDVSFSRTRHSLPWGVPVPDDDTQVMYVWCDALTNYISGLGFGGKDADYQKFWDNDEVERIHVIGKDITRFHLAIWPGMLLSAGVKLPTKILVHGFITADGEKMSKSLGNVVDPFEYTKEYGVDPLRYYLLREIPIGRDGDFTRQHFEEIYNAHLANGLGNLVNRVVIMSKKHEVNLTDFEDLIDGEKTITEFWKNYKEKMDGLLLNEGVQVVWDLIDFANKKIDQEKPWVLAKEDVARMEKVLAGLVEVIRHIAIMLSPIMPETSQRIRKILGLGEIDSMEKVSQWKGEKITNLQKPEVLFPRIEK